MRSHSPLPGPRPGPRPGPGWAGRESSLSSTQIFRHTHPHTHSDPHTQTTAHWALLVLLAFAYEISINSRFAIAKMAANSFRFRQPSRRLHLTGMTRASTESMNAHPNSSFKSNLNLNLTPDRPRPETEAEAEAEAEATAAAAAGEEFRGICGCSTLDSET